MLSKGYIQSLKDNLLNAFGVQITSERPGFFVNYSVGARGRLVGRKVSASIPR